MILHRRVVWLLSVVWRKRILGVFRVRRRRYERSRRRCARLASVAEDEERDDTREDCGTTETTDYATNDRSNIACL